MKQTTTSVIALAIVFAAGCGSTRGTSYAPVVDKRGHDDSKIALDTAECQQYAKAQEGVIAQKMLGDMLRGGRMQRNGTDSEVELITKRCLTGRGYSVLN